METQETNRRESIQTIHVSKAVLVHLTISFFPAHSAKCLQEELHALQNMMAASVARCKHFRVFSFFPSQGISPLLLTYQLIGFWARPLIGLSPYLLFGLLAYRLSGLSGYRLLSYSGLAAYRLTDLSAYPDI